MLERNSNYALSTLGIYTQLKYMHLVQNTIRC